MLEATMADWIETSDGNERHYNPGLARERRDMIRGTIAEIAFSATQNDDPDARDAARDALGALGISLAQVQANRDT